MNIEIVTKQDLENFRISLIDDLKNILKPGQTQRREWLKSREVRALPGISPRTLQNLRINRKLPFRKIGTILYYRATDVQALLEDAK